MTVKSSGQNKNTHSETPPPHIDTGNAKTIAKSSRFFTIPNHPVIRALFGLAFVVVTAVILCIVPYTRYGILGYFIKKDLTVNITDNRTGKPVSQVAVTLVGHTARTDAQGRVTLRGIPVGTQPLTVDKRYYKSTNTLTLIPILSAPKSQDLKIIATGRQTTVKITNKITGQPLADVAVTMLDTSATTSDTGEAVIVLPADKISVTATLKLPKFNTVTTAVTTTATPDLIAKNSFTLTPVGHVYFLSKRTGKIDVMSSNLDGTDPKVLVAGTGNEIDYDTKLVASPDWKYLALLATREDRPKLYLIKTDTGELSLIDQGDISITLTGWQDGHLLYQVYRDNQTPQNKRFAIKTFNAAADNLSIIDESASTTEWGSAESNYFNSVILSRGLLTYIKDWSLYAWSTDQHKIEVITVNPDGSNKQIIRTFDDGVHKSLSAYLSAPDQLIYTYSTTAAGKEMNYRYTVGGSFESIASKPHSIFDGYNYSYIMSPSGARSLWTESRDGKKSVFIGNAHADNARSISSSGDYAAYGWFGEDYILLSKNGSELFIVPADIAAAPTKITDYHKFDYNSYGGGGYGGN